MQTDNATKRADQRVDEVRVVDAIEVDDLAHAMFEGVRRLVDTYGSIRTPEMLEEVREHCRVQAGVTLQSLRAGSIPPHTEFGFVRATAARRARQQLPLSALLHAYRVGYTVVWDRIRAVMRRTSVSLDAALSLADICLAYVNAISVVASEAYMAEQQRVLLDQERTRRTLLETLVRGDRPYGDAEVLQTALRLEARGKLFVLVVAANSDEPSEPQALAQQLRTALTTVQPAFADAGAPSLSDAMNDRAVAIVVRPELEDTDVWMRSLAAAIEQVPERERLVFGLSTGWSELADVPRAYKEAVRAIALARKDQHFVPLSRTTLFDDLVALADATTFRLLPEWTQALVDEDRRAGGELSTTLQAYLEGELSVGRAAAELDVHPNTIRYRIHRIESITGGSLRSFAHLFDIVAGLRLMSRRRP